MAGTSSGMVKMFAAGARVATGKNQQTGRLTELLYTPAYLRASDQKKISAKVQIPVLINLYGRTDPVHLRLVAWGGRADLFVKNLNQGKEMNWELEPRSYWSDLFYSDGVQIMDRDGSAKTVRQQSYTIVDFGWGSDSQRTLFEEINQGIMSGEGRRPANWNVQDHPDNTLWKQMLAARKALAYMGGDRYGFGRVLYPREGGIILLGDQSYSAERAAGGAQNLINTTTQAGNVIQLTPGQGPAKTVVGQPGGNMVAAGNVPLETAVADALNVGGHCVKCGTAVAAGGAFCGKCGTPVVAAAALTTGPTGAAHVNV